MSTATSTRPSTRPDTSTSRPDRHAPALEPSTAVRPVSRTGVGRARPAVPRAGVGVRRTQPAGLVLTRRGRRLVRAVVLTVSTSLVAVLLVLAWLGAAATVAPGASAGDGEPGVVSGVVGSWSSGGSASSVEVVVQPGDTLWQIARSAAPERDPRSVVAEIVRTNDLRSTAVAAGAVLEVPAG